MYRRRTVLSRPTRAAHPPELRSRPARPQEPAKSWWHSAQFWGGLGAAAGWGMTGSAIWDASNKGPEIISLNMTSVMLVYSSLFAR